MPRLDVYLVEKGFFKSRQSAKRAIKDGHITVNGHCPKPSTQVSGNETIEVSEDMRDAHFGYFKLKEIHQHTQSVLIQPGMKALDIGSSAGGFLEYLLENDVVTTGIEVSEEFIEELESLVNDNENLSILIADAFLLDPLEIFNKEEFDLLLIDVTTDPKGTLSLVERYSSVLKRGKHMILALKATKEEIENMRVSSTLDELGFTEIHVIQLDSHRKETHTIALRR